MKLVATIDSVSWDNILSESEPAERITDFRVNTRLAREAINVGRAAEITALRCMILWLTGPSPLQTSICLTILTFFFAIVECVIAIFYRIVWNIILSGACTKIMSMPKMEDLMMSMTKMMSIIWICNVCHGYLLSNIILSRACCYLQSLAHWTFL